MTSTTTKLSVIILNHRHDRRLTQAIESAQFADEVLIVDYQSQADYSQLSKKLEFKLIKMESDLNDFSEARNEALLQAKHRWVFFLDSDEQIRAKDRAEIKRIIRHDLGDGVFVKRRDVYQNQVLHHGEPRQNRLLRMGKKGLMRWDRPVHEVAWIEGDIIESQICLQHKAHLSMTDFISDVARYAQNEANYRYQRQIKFRLWHLLVLPIGKFMQNFWLKLGFLDGTAGLIYAFTMSLHSFFVRVFLYELENDR